MKRLSKTVLETERSLSCMCHSKRQTHTHMQTHFVRHSEKPIPEEWCTPSARMIALNIVFFLTSAQTQGTQYRYSLAVFSM